MRLLAALLVSALLVTPAFAKKPKPLYKRIGGMAVITAVVDDFIGNIVGDGRVSGFYATTDIPQFKAMVAGQICKASGGPCEYKGRDMRAVHTDMGMESKDFDALVQDLSMSLDKLKVPKPEKAELLAKLTPVPKAAGKKRR